MESKTFTVPNISCGHCVHTIESELGELKGVSEVKAEEKTTKVTVKWDNPANWGQIEKVLTEIDYPPARA